MALMFAFVFVISLFIFMKILGNRPFFFFKNGELQEMNFEDNVNNLKAVYETKVDTLEKTMDYYKSYIENFYRKKIQQTRNTNMESVVLIEGNLPIMQITSEHNDTLKRLRELYDMKIKELETTFFSTLRAITAKRMDDMSSK